MEPRNTQRGEAATKIKAHRGDAEKLRDPNYFSPRTHGYGDEEFLFGQIEIQIARNAQNVEKNMKNSEHAKIFKGILYSPRFRVEKSFPKRKGFAGK
jgi:hypothetical protein